MNPISTNPFKVLGLSLTATEREIAKQIDILETYAEMGKAKELITDFPLFSVSERSTLAIEEAKKQIEQSESRLFYSLFWFWKNNSTDELAFDLLKEGNVQKALTIWEKLTFLNKHTVYKQIPLHEDLIQESNTWSSQDDESHCLKKDEHQYKIERKKDTNYSIPTVNADLKYTENWTIEVSIEWSSGTDNSGYGIVFGRDKGSYFSFEIASTGYYCISRYVEWAYHKIIPWTQSPIIEKRGKNRLLIKKINSEIHYCINGTYVERIESETFFGSYFGFKVGNNQTVSFRKFKFCILEEDKTYGEGIEVSLKNLSNIKNLSTLYLALSTDKSYKQFDINSFKKGIVLAKHIFASESINTYSKLIAGDKYNYDPEKTLLFYVRSIIDYIRPFIDCPGGISLNEFVAAFKDFPIVVKQILNSKFFSKQLQNINDEIENVKVLRRSSASEAIEYGKILVKKTNSDLVFLREGLGVLDYQYQTIADKLSAEIVQCGIDTFNSWKTSGGEVDFAKAVISEERYQPEYEYALSIAITDRAKEKAKENLESCISLVANKQFYTCWFCGSNPPEELYKFEINIYKETSRNYFPRRVQFKYLPIEIPRCNNCHSIHSKSSDNFKYFLIGFSIVGLIIGAIDDGNWFAGLLIGAILGWIAGLAIKSKQASNADIKKTNHSTIREFPTLRKFLAEGWQFSKPSA